MRPQQHVQELFKKEPRLPHLRLRRRIVGALVLVLAADAVGTVAMRLLEDGKGQIHNVWDAFFFTTVQLLTVSSQMPNPLTTGGRIVDIVLEFVALGLVSTLAGSFASFFLHLDRADES